MLSKRLRVKLILLLALVASAVGAEMSSPAAACGYVRCTALYSNGAHVGYGCITGTAFGGCDATVNGCRLTPCA